MSGRVSTFPLLLLLILAAIAAAAGQTAHSLHRLNDRVISNAFTGQPPANEVVCTFCLYQVLSAVYQIGNERVRRDIRDALGPQDAAALGEDVLKKVGGLSTIGGTVTGYYQRGEFDQCPTTTKHNQCARISNFIQNLQRGQPVNFNDRNTVNTINTAVERATGGKIKNLFTFLAPSTRLVFASTLVFQDNWPSRLATVKGRFTLSRDRSIEDVPYLVNTDHMPYLDSGDVLGVSIPYQDPPRNQDQVLASTGPAIRLYCFIAKGNSGDIRHLLHQQHYVDLANAPPRFVHVRLPKFDISSKTYDYEPFMRLMGMRTMFENGLGPRDELKVDQLVHKAVIEVNEDGTSAAGAAGVAFVPLSAPPEGPKLRFDKPFVCSLVLDELVQPLFTAYIADPSQK